MPVEAPVVPSTRSSAGVHPLAVADEAAAVADVRVAGGDAVAVVDLDEVAVRARAAGVDDAPLFAAWIGASQPVPRSTA